MIRLYTHGGSGNHGCEAIVRSTLEILREPLILFSNHKDQDLQYGLDRICTVMDDAPKELKRGSTAWFRAAVQTKLTGKEDLVIKNQHVELLSSISSGDICLSVGGDNYCYAGTEHMAALNRYIRKSGARTVLWGCSVEPSLTQQPQIAEDMARYSLITARESISYRALQKVNPNTVLIPDPAFVLPKVELPLPEGWLDGNMVGINASPMILQHAQNGELVYAAYCRLMQTILDSTDCGIALIPHVVWESNDDREVLQQLYERFSGSGRVILLEDHNCMELKGYIARCRFFIGARTHATIAAYSSGVPTLAVGYSVKSRGIALDLFGTQEHCVLPVQMLSNVDALAQGFVWLKEHEMQVRTHLASVMPAYIQRAYTARDLLDDL